MHPPHTRVQQQQQLRIVYCGSLKVTYFNI